MRLPDRLKDENEKETEFLKRKIISLKQELEAFRMNTTFRDPSTAAETKGIPLLLKIGYNNLVGYRTGRYHKNEWEIFDSFMYQNKGPKEGEQIIGWAHIIESGDKAYNIVRFHGGPADGEIKYFRKGAEIPTYREEAELIQPLSISTGGIYASIPIKRTYRLMEILGETGVEYAYYLME